MSRAGHKNTLLTVLALMLVCGRGAGAAPLFDARFLVTNVQAQTQSLAVGDLNGDHNVDLVLTHHGTGEAPGDSLVRVLLGDGMGGFAFKADYNVGSSPFAVTIADMNRDGIPDVVVGNSGAKSVSILYGTGDGSLRPGPRLAAGNRPLAIVAEDFDRDHRMDLAIVNTGNGARRPERGDKAAPVSLQAIAVGADSVKTDSSSVTLWYGSGSKPGGAAPRRAKSKGSTTQSKTAVSTGGGETSAAFRRGTELDGGWQPVAAVACDWNADGTTDLVIAERGQSTLAIWPGKASGGFGTAQEIETPGEPLDVVVGDVDHDGHPDAVAVVASTDRVKPGWCLFVLHGGVSAAVPAPVWHVAGSVFRLQLADLDRDGTIDVVALGRQGIVTLHGHGDGTFGDPQTVRVDLGGAFAVARVDGDAIPDVVAANPQGFSVAVLRGNADGSLGGGRNFETGASPNNVTSADLNGDGRLDLVVCNGGGSTLSLFLSQKSGGFAPRQEVAVGDGPLFAACGDLDGDGDTDIAVAQVQGKASLLSVLRNHGDGTFDPKVDIAAGVDPVRIDLVDINGDHKLDWLVPRATTPEVLLYMGKGDGTVVPALHITTPHLVYVFVAGDLNGDGKLDFVAADPRKGAVTAFIGLGGGNFAAAPSFRPRIEPAALAIADVNADGKADLVIGGRRTLGVGNVLAGMGDGTFGQRIDIALSAGAGAITLADVNGDGKPDLLAPDAQASAVTVSLHDAGAGFEPHQDFGTGPDPSAIAVGDFDGDGHVDLAVTNRQGNSLTLLLGHAAR